MVNPASSSQLRWVQPLLFVLLAWVACAALHGHWSWADWSEPQWLVGDPVEVYGRVKIASEQPLDMLLNHSVVTRLGAPGPADWSNYPMPDRLVFTAAGLLARLTGVIAAVHLTANLIFLLNAASFCWCARWLRARWEWAAGLGLVFALCNYNVRWGITLSLSQTFLFPPLVLLCALAARPGARPAVNRAWLIFGLLSGVWLGLSNPYLAYFSGVLGGGALLLGLIRRSPVRRLQPLLVFLGVLTLTFISAHAAFVLRQMHGAANGALVRSLGDMRVYALQPLDWIVPPADHRVPMIGSWGRTYFDWRGGQGEFFYNYLGALGLIGLLILLFVSGRRLVRGQWRRLDVPYGFVWLMVFGLVGGINYQLGAAGLDLFRASTRIGIFALIWVLFFICHWLSTRTRQMPRATSFGLAAALTVATAWEQTPSLSDKSARQDNVRRWGEYQKLMATLEQQLPSGATVFQLPIVPFPEAGRTVNMPDYEHLLPFVTSTNLHYSYGSMRNSLPLRWAQFVSRQPADRMVAALESTGFSALWIDTRGYADSARALLRDLRLLEVAPVPQIPGLPYLHVFRLHPPASTRPPDLRDVRLLDPWSDRPAPPDQPALLAGVGWYDSENNDRAQWRWAAREAALAIWNPGGATQVTLQFRLDGPAASVVTVRMNRREIWHGKPGPATQNIPLELRSGATVLIWRLNGATFRPGKDDPRVLGFMVENLSVSVP